MVKRFGAGTLVTVMATVLIWSTTFAGLVAALKHFTPGHLLFIRWTLTAVIVACVGAVTRMRLPELRDVPRIVVAGMLGFGIYQIALVFGQTGVSATMAGFLINLSPVFTTVIAVSLGREQATPFTWTGLGISMAGVAVLGMAQHGGFGAVGPSAALVVFAALCFAGYTIVSKPLLSRYRPIEVTSYSLIAGVLPFAFFARGALAEVMSATPAQLATVVFLAVLPGGIAYFLWARVIAALTPGVASRFLYLVPVIGIPVAWLWVGDAPSVLAIAGGLVTVAGVAVASAGRVPLRVVGAAPSPSHPLGQPEPAVDVA